jgi:hypothetical protein
MLLFVPCWLTNIEAANSVRDLNGISARTQVGQHRLNAAQHAVSREATDLTTIRRHFADLHRSAVVFRVLPNGELRP